MLFMSARRVAVWLLLFAALPLTACLREDELAWADRFADCVELEAPAGSITAMLGDMVSLDVALVNRCGVPVPLREPYCGSARPPVSAWFADGNRSYFLTAMGAAIPLGVPCFTDEGQTYETVDPNGRQSQPFRWNGSVYRTGLMHTDGPIAHKGGWEMLPPSEFVVSIEAVAPHKGWATPTWKAQVRVIFGAE